MQYIGQGTQNFFKCHFDPNWAELMDLGRQPRQCEVFGNRSLCVYSISH